MSIKAFFAVFKLRVKNVLQYRTAAWAGLMTQFAWGFMYMMLYTAYYASGAGGSTMTLPELISYSWLRQAFLMLMAVWIRDNEINEMIVTGQVAYELCKPVDLYFYWYARFIAMRLAGAAMRFWPILVVASLLPVGMRLNPPASLVSLGLFILALMGGLLLMVAISMLVQTSMFKTMSVAGSFAIASVAIDFLSGTYIPIPLMPGWLQQALYTLPFSYVADLPLRIWSGNIPPAEALPLIGMQFIWLIIIAAIGRFILNKTLKNLVVMGG